MRGGLEDAAKQRGCQPEDPPPDEIDLSGLPEVYRLVMCSGCYAIRDYTEDTCPHCGGVLQLFDSTIDRGSLIRTLAVALGGLREARDRLREQEINRTPRTDRAQANLTETICRIEEMGHE